MVHISMNNNISTIAVLLSSSFLLRNGSAFVGSPVLSERRTNQNEQQQFSNTRLAAVEVLLEQAADPALVSATAEAVIAATTSGASATGASAAATATTAAAAVEAAATGSMTSSHLLAAVSTFYQTQPYLADFLTCATKASLADIIAQKTAESYDNDTTTSSSKKKKNNDSDTDCLEFSRTLAFLLYGGLYQGMVQCFLYTHLYPCLFGSEVTITSVLTQAGIDNFLLAPFVCLPTVYSLKSLLAGGTPKEGMDKYLDHIDSQSILWRYWSLWFPVQCLNFSIVPEYMRVPFGAVVSFAWMFMLSGISSSSSNLQQEEAAKTKEGQHVRGNDARPSLFFGGATPQGARI